MKISILLALVILTIFECSSADKATQTKFHLSSHYQKVESTFNDSSDFVDKYMKSSLEIDHNNFYDDLAFNSKVDPNWLKNKDRTISALAKRFKEKKNKIRSI